MNRIVFMGTPDFAVPILQKLIETQQVVGVVTQPDKPAGRGKKMRPSPVKVAAQAAGLPVFQPKSLRKKVQAAQLREWEPDAIVVAAFGQILRPHVLDLPPHGCINVHASLLPRWRGASPIQHAILEGDAQSGVCLMHMDVGLDTGAVYSCESTPLAQDETAQSLHDRLAELGALLIERDFPKVLAGELTAVPQDDALSCYAPMISKADGQIDWQNSAEKIDRQIRAMSPWPSAFTFWNGKQLKIANGVPLAEHDSSVKQASGTVLKIQDNIAIVAGDGLIQLDRIQLQGKKAMRVTDFVHGRPQFIGDRLTSSQ